MRGSWLPLLKLVAAFEVEVFEEIEIGALVRCRGGGQAETAEGADEGSAMHL